MTRYSGVSAVMGGCDQCHGLGIAGWFARNALAVAARHHTATGHTTWAEQVITVRWGERPDDDRLFARTAEPTAP